MCYTVHYILTTFTTNTICMFRCYGVFNFDQKSKVKLGVENFDTKRVKVPDTFKQSGVLKL